MRPVRSLLKAARTGHRGDRELGRRISGQTADEPVEYRAGQHRQLQPIPHDHDLALRVRLNPPAHMIGDADHLSRAESIPAAEAAPLRLPTSSVGSPAGRR
jgi:hypothetical protein